MKAGDAVLAEDKHQPVYAELVKDYKVDYIAGGAGQNSIRVAQWMLNACGKPNSTAYFGCVGNDEYAAQMKAQAAGDGVNVQYMTTEEAATGTCAVLVTADGERSLIANLAAANLFKVAHLEAEASKAVSKMIEAEECDDVVTTIDAEDPSRSTWCRYINHASEASAEVNLEVKVDMARKLIWFEALRDIAVGEELHFDYGDEYGIDKFDKGDAA